MPHRIQVNTGYVLPWAFSNQYHCIYLRISIWKHSESYRRDSFFHILQVMLGCNLSSREFFRQLFLVSIEWLFSWNQWQIDRFTLGLRDHSTSGKYVISEANALQSSWTKGSCTDQLLLSTIYCTESGCRTDLV